MAVVLLVLIAALAFGVWLAIGAARWLWGFAAAPTGRKLVHGSVQWALFCWFVNQSWQAAAPPFFQSDKLGLDARIYLGGAQRWLAGGDPWTATVEFHDFGTYGFHFAAPPPSVLLGVPFAWMPDRLFANLVIVASFAAGFYLLRAVRLPAWWIVFPPLLIGILSANPVVIGLACLVSGRRWAAPIAFAAKIYFAAGLVAERRWREIAFVAAVVAAMVVVLLPLWLQYAADYSSVSATIAQESAGGFSATRAAPLFVVTAVAVAALATVDWRAAWWLAVPALAPFAEFHASVFALPVMAPGLGALLAIAGTPADAVAPWAICAYSAWRVGRRAAELASLRLPDWLDVQVRRAPSNLESGAASSAAATTAKAV
jgi:hypothetical protein